MKQLSLIDMAFLLPESPRTPNHLCMVGVYDPSTSPSGRAPTFAEILEKLEACLPSAPSLRHRLVHVPLQLDRPYWIEDPDFDLEFHVRHLALPKPGDWRQFCVQVARLHARPLDLARSPWELTVIEGLDGMAAHPAGCFGTVLKVHHSAIDGVSGVELLNVMHDLVPDPPPSERAIDGWVPEDPPSSMGLMARAGANALRNPLTTARVLAANGGPLTRELVGRLRKRTPRLTVERTRFNTRVSAHRVFDHVQCSLADLKQIKSAVEGATINDACISIVGDTLRRYLEHVGEPPAAPLITMVPVSTRTPQQAGSGGNQISMMRVSMHTDIVDPVERLRAIADETRTKKAAQDGVAVPVLLEVAQSVPGALIGAAVRGLSAFSERAPVMSNTILTNVPGSPVAQYFLGCELVNSTGCVPLVDGVGLFHCVSSYNGTFTFMVTACRELLPDIGDYVAAMEASIADHLAATAPAAKPAGAARKRRLVDVNAS